MDTLPKEPCEKQKRKRWESAMSHQIAKAYPDGVIAVE
jgi:hypothetical protein